MSKILIIPGYGNSDSQHWQTIWENKYAGITERVELPDFLSTKKEEWSEAILSKLSGCNENYIIVAHSLGALAFAHVYSENELKNVKGVLLVAPPDVQFNVNSAFLTEFANLKDFNFLIPAVLVASSNDPYYSLDRSIELAKEWNAQHINIGDKGHVNSESKLGEWPEGIEILNRLFNI